MSSPSARLYMVQNHVLVRQPHEMRPEFPFDRRFTRTATPHLHPIITQTSSIGGIRNVSTRR